MARLVRVAFAVCLASVSLVPHASCGGEDAGIAPSEKVSFDTSDKVTIYGTFYPGAGAEAPAVLCLPMMRHTRETYSGFAKRLQRLGYSVLAIDMRGHGESLSKAGRRLDISEFKTADFRDMALDVEAALRFLAREKKLKPSRSIVVGASIGSTAAILAAAGYPEIDALVLLSPGRSYREVDVTKPFKKCAPRPVLIVVGDMDKYSSASARELAAEAPDSTRLVVRPTRAHGTDLLARDEVAEAVTDWIEDKAPAAKPPTEGSEGG
jgi:dienelactone hydrolase